MEWHQYFLQVLASILVLLTRVQSKRNHAVYCGACIGLVEEMNWGLALTDEKEMLQVGSFRIDSHGKQKLNEIPLKYTELHLSDLLEEACNKVGHYAESHKEGTDKVNFIRTDSRDGQPISLRHVQISHDTQKLLKFACDTVVEENEDEIIQMFKSKEEDVHNRLCVDITGLCIPENVTDFSAANKEMVAEAIAEAEERKMEDEARIKAEEEARIKAEGGSDEDDEDFDEFEDKLRRLEEQGKKVAEPVNEAKLNDYIQEEL